MVSFVILMAEYKTTVALALRLMNRVRPRMKLQRLEESQLAVFFNALRKASFKDIWIHILTRIVSHDLFYSSKKLEFAVLQFSPWPCLRVGKE